MNLQALHTNPAPHTIYRCIAGSRAYGTATIHSDTDIRGIFIHPARAYLSLNAPVNQVSDARGDTVYYSLKRFLELAAQANPNILELLYSPNDCVLYSGPLMDQLRSQRSTFISQRVFESHVGYARSQLKRSRGRNKWINNPQAKDPPDKSQFCWFISKNLTSETSPYRPVALSVSGIDLEQCHCAAVEHIHGMYRLYHYGKSAKGVFREGNLVCESIPQEDESRYCIGLLLYNQQGYQKAKRDHEHYWQWVRNRNNRRWRTQERGEIDYDAKNMMHTFRLLLSGQRILQTGEPQVRFEGEDLALLRRILSGAFACEALLELAEQKIAALNSFRDTSGLPENPPLKQIEALFREITMAWEHQYG